MHDVARGSADDVRAVIHSVFRHRIITNYTALAEGLDADNVIDKLLEAVPETAGKA